MRQMWSGFFLLLFATFGCQSEPTPQERVDEAMLQADYDALFSIYFSGEPFRKLVALKFADLPVETVAPRLESCALGERANATRVVCLSDLRRVDPSRAEVVVSSVWEAVDLDRSKRPGLEALTASVEQAQGIVGPPERKLRNALLQYALEVLVEDAQEAQELKHLCTATNLTMASAMLAMRVGHEEEAVKLKKQGAALKRRSDSALKRARSRAEPICKKDFAHCSVYLVNKACEKKYWKCENVSAGYGSKLVMRSYAEEDVKRLENERRSADGDAKTIIDAELKRARAVLERRSNDLRQVDEQKAKHCNGRDTCERDFRRDRCSGESTCVEDRIRTGSDATAANAVVCGSGQAEWGERLNTLL